MFICMYVSRSLMDVHMNVLYFLSSKCLPGPSVFYSLKCLPRLKIFVSVKDAICATYVGSLYCLEMFRCKVCLVEDCFLVEDGRHTSLLKCSVVCYICYKMYCELLSL